MAYFLGVEIMLVVALDVLVDRYSATSTITGYPGAVWLRRTGEAAAACAEYGGCQQDSCQGYYQGQSFYFSPPLEPNLS